MKLFTVPNLLTACNLFCGLLAIVCSVAARIDWAPILLLLAAVFDFFDGFAARLFKSNSELGKQLDSLADVVSFGVAPGIMMMVVLVASINIGGPIEVTERFPSHVHYEWNNWVNTLFYDVPNSLDASIKYFPLIALIIPVLSMFRLAKFNIDTRQSDSFIGVPTPLNTLFLSFFPLLMWTEFHVWKDTRGSLDYILNVYTIGAVLVIMSFLLVAEIKLLALKFKNYSWKDNAQRYILLLASVVLILTLRVWSIPLIVFLYIVISFFVNFFDRNNNEIQSRN